MRRNGRAAAFNPNIAGNGKLFPTRRRDGREAEGGGLLNRYTGQNLYRGFESLSLRQLLCLEIVTFSVLSCERQDPAPDCVS